MFERDAVPAPLRRWIPDRARLVFAGHGLTSTVAFVEPGDVVLKRCATPEYLDWLRREHTVLGALSTTDLPVPRALDFADRGDEAWLVMTRLPGAPCSAVLPRLLPAARRRLLRTVGAFLRRLHATPIPEPLRDDRPWLERRLEQAERNLPWCDGSAALLAELRRTRPAPAPETLVHGDLDLDNLLVDGGRVTGLVDWSGGDRGDPRFDLALALRPGDGLPLTPDDERAFFAAYGSELDPDTRRWLEDLDEFF